ncbi:response regulator transcription factor [Neoroseomonas rubea]|uniref:response regulator transcription factor n=1 Tax=Neoroseomonas rubea TaxID=2748666 RepID=UPI0018DF327E|nr:response regulator [Roseomonas rubea]
MVVADVAPVEHSRHAAAQLAAGASIHVIDDDEGVRVAFGLLLRAAGLTVVLHSSAQAFLDAQPTLTEPIACVLTDLRMPDLDGIGLLRRLRAMGFTPPVIMITARGDVPVAVRAMKEGAADFIEKPCSDRRLLNAIATALERYNSTNSPPSGQSPQDAARARMAALSLRERQVLELLAAGHANKDVARVLALSPRTVEIHRARMMSRLGVNSFADAVRVAVQADVQPVDGPASASQTEGAPSGPES